MREAREIATSIQSTPMPFSGPLFRFALFQVRDDEIYLYVCCHHIVIDGYGLALVCRRIASVYSASFLAHRFRHPSSVRCRICLTANWITKHPNPMSKIRHIGLQIFRRRPDTTVVCPKAWATAIRMGLLSRCRWILRSFPGRAAVPGVERAPINGDHRGLRARRSRWSAEGREVVLDFPVSRRVVPESKTLPGMVAGVVPLVLQLSPESAVSDFCAHVDTRIREALQHQRYPVQALERKSHLRGPVRCPTGWWSTSSRPDSRCPSVV